nr:hypothetical protein [Micromonospora chaiyaphumensis]
MSSTAGGAVPDAVGEQAAPVPVAGADLAPAEHQVGAQRPVRDGHVPHPDDGQQRGADRERGGVEHERPARSGGPDQQPGQGRPGQAAGVAGGAHERVGPLPAVGVDGAGDQWGRGRHGERRRRAADGAGHREVGQGGCAAEQFDADDQLGDAAHQVGAEGHAPGVEAVGDDAAKGEQQQPGHHRAAEHHGEGGGGAGGPQHGQRQCGGHHGVAERGDGAAEEQQAEGAEPEGMRHSGRILRRRIFRQRIFRRRRTVGG